jgi:hypothetical protein
MQQLISLDINPFFFFFFAFKTKTLTNNSKYKILKTLFSPLCYIKHTHTKKKKKTNKLYRVLTTKTLITRVENSKGLDLELVLASDDR